MTATRMRAMLVALAAAGLAVAAVLWQTDVPGGLVLPQLDARDVFGAAQVERSATYARPLRALWLASTIAQLAALLVLAGRGRALARRLGAGGPEPRAGRAVARGLAMLAIVLVTLWLVRLPFGAVAHWWRRRHGISEQGWVHWLVAPWLELLGAAALLAAALVCAMLLARRLGERWWLAGGALVAVLGAAAILLGPLVHAPRLDPLDDPALAAEVRQLAARVGVEVGAVEVLRASERTTRANAEVAGLGPTKRVILWDTLLDGRYGRDEVRFVVAHELAHVERRHLLKGATWLALLALPLAAAVAAATRRAGGMAEPPAVPVAALTLVLVQLAVLPVGNAISRRYEAEADWVALEATREPEAAVALLRRFSQTNLADPEPPRWWRLLSTHPSLLERVELARAWEPTLAGVGLRAGLR